MASHVVNFEGVSEPVTVPTGTLLVEAAREAGVEIYQPCGGQGRCGRCAVQITRGDVRRRSSLRLTAGDVALGYALACQSIIEGDITVAVPPQEKIERRLTTDRTVAEIGIPEGYDPVRHPTIRRVQLRIPSPSVDDQTDDFSRLERALRQETDLRGLTASLGVLRTVGERLRQGDWQVAAILESYRWDCPDCPARLIDLQPGHLPGDTPLWGAAVDIGTTTVTVWLVDLRTGQVRAQTAEYNQQITRGEDVISRIIFASKNSGGEEMRRLVVATVNELLERACKRVQASPNDIYKLTISGNSTMMHLLLGIPAESIRLSPFITAVNQVPTLCAGDLDLVAHPEAVVDCLPGIASYVGADITAGVLASGLDTTEKVTLFMDVGTNGEIVLGSHDWLITCACSAGPAFEGAGMVDGMRATKGAIEEVWINSQTYEPSYRVIGNVKPRGVCGSGLISLLAELFLTGIIDKGGHIKSNLDTPRIRQGAHGWEYVLAHQEQTAHGRDIVITGVDIDNLLRAKAAIYAGFTVLAERVGVPLETVDQVLIGGSFGKYINVEKAIEIGLLPDMPWDRFEFLGNTSVHGAYLALLDRRARARVQEIASRMTYIELSADNSFYEAFMSALFLPHTDLSRFPTVAAAMGKEI